VRVVSVRRSPPIGAMRFCPATPLLLGH
jgi:hypothetical protein